jgi:hypothetical protein
MLVFGYVGSEIGVHHYCIAFFKTSKEKTDGRPVPAKHNQHDNAGE